MPCYTRTTITATMQGWTKDRVDKAIAETGLNRVKFENGQIIGTELEIKQVKQAYAKVVLMEGAKRFGWTASAEVKTQSTIQFNLNRR
jgi:hypothetical protein